MVASEIREERYLRQPHHVFPDGWPALPGRHQIGKPLETGQRQRVIRKRHWGANRSASAPGTRSFYWIATAFGYALLGVASWAWLNNLFKTKDGHPGMRLVLWLVALACLVLGVAYLGLFYELIEIHRHPHVGLRRQGVSYLLSMIGFCLTALGFWIAGRTLGSTWALSTQEVSQLH